MIKKFINYSLRIFLIIVLFISNVTVVDAAKKNEPKTLADLRDNLKALQDQKKKNDNSVNYTKSQINTKKNDITTAKNNIEKSESNIALAKNNIEKSNKRIDELSEKAKELIVFYELLKNNDSYYEYVTGASSTTELIMRQDAIDILIKYNGDKVKELEKLIEDNQKEELNLKKYQNQLEKDITFYENKINDLNNNLASLTEITEDINDEIKNQKVLIDYYVSIGCKEKENLDDCIKVAGSRTWIKPLVKAYVSSPFGWRSSGYHNGIDLAITEGTPVYAASSGLVAAITVRSSCGGNKVYVYSNVAGVNYTVSYIHLLTINVKVGDIVNTNTIIGKVGGGSTRKSLGGYDGCTTGAHLHFGIAKGKYLSDYKDYSTLVARSIEPPGYPKKGGWFYSRTQWFG